MDPEDFKASLARIGWKKADFCRATDTHATTISRWMNGTTPIPVWVPGHLRLLADLQTLHHKHLVAPARQEK